MQHLLKDMTDERVNLGSCSWDPHQVSPPEPVRGETDGGGLLQSPGSWVGANKQNSKGTAETNT